MKSKIHEFLKTLTEKATRKKQLFFLAFVIATITSQAQSYAVPTVFEDWFTTDGTQNFFYKGEVISDAVGNTYMCGATINQQGNYDILVSKYSSLGGSLVWSAQYNGNGNGLDGASSIPLDEKGEGDVCGN